MCIVGLLLKMEIALGIRLIKSLCGTIVKATSKCSNFHRNLKYYRIRELCIQDMIKLLSHVVRNVRNFG